MNSSVPAAVDPLVQCTFLGLPCRTSCPCCCLVSAGMPRCVCVRFRRKIVHLSSLRTKLHDSHSNTFIVNLGASPPLMVTDTALLFDAGGVGGRVGGCSSVGGRADRCSFVGGRVDSFPFSDMSPDCVQSKRLQSVSACHKPVPAHTRGLNPWRPSSGLAK